MFKGLGNIASLMRNAGEISGKMGQMSEELKQKIVSGSAGGGLVEVEANGLGQILKVKIDPSLVEKNETEMIEDLLPAAVNQAIAKSKSLHLDSMKDITGALPGMEDALAKMGMELGDDVTAADSDSESTPDSEPQN